MPQPSGPGQRCDCPALPDEYAGRQAAGDAVQAGFYRTGPVFTWPGIGIADAEVGARMSEHLLAVDSLGRQIPPDSPEAVHQPGQRRASRVPGQAHPLAQQPRVEDPAAVLLDWVRPGTAHPVTLATRTDANLQAQRAPVSIS